MKPTINGKTFMDCNEADLQILIDNPDYREGDYLDYKASFSFLDIPKNDPHRMEHIAAFRSDVCQFANAEGGYLIYGIKDKKGQASEIVGIEIPGDNTDKFELERKNNLVPIMPKIPSVKFKFIPLANGKYVVVIAVTRDGYAPYLHLEGEHDFRIYKRVGNGKKALSYLELKNMFIQSRSLENDVLLYRQRRLYYFRDNNDSVAGKTLRFMLLHIIPETFTDSTYNQNVYQLMRSGKAKYSPMFSSMGCSGFPFPNVDGLRYGHYQNASECFVNNNGIVECFLALDDNYTGNLERSTNEYLAHSKLWDEIESVVAYYAENFLPSIDASRVFVCLSFAGCKGLVTETQAFGNNSAIDRNELICSPIAFYKDGDTDETLRALKVEYLLSIGIRYAKELDDYVNNSKSS